MLRTKISSLILACVLGLVVLVSSCSDDDNGSPAGPTATSTIQLTLNGLAPLPEGQNYQAWAIEYYGGYYYGYRMAFFNIDQSGRMIDPATDSLLTGPFTVNLAAEDVYGIGISLELSDTPVSASSYAQIMGGRMTDGSAELSVSNTFGIGQDFSGVSGKYVLATPTDTVSNNELSGVWFIDLTGGISTRGLNLPELPGGWTYEGWARINGTWVSTGKFTAANSADESNKYSGSFAAPDFPGEDFLVNPPAGLTFPTELPGGSLLVTLEPWGDYDVEPDKPFFLNLLSADIPSGAASHTTYYMTTLSGQLPTGLAVVQ